jgi:hypothetical protein
MAEWVTGKWKTAITATSDSKGVVNDRGHLGRYEITVTIGSKSVKLAYHLAKDSLPLVVRL